MSERPEVTLHIGGVYATREPTVIKTLLGSCIAVCLLDPHVQVGGMNHFMLPAPGSGPEDAVDSARFGVHAMDLLIGAMQKAGGERCRLKAKVFGGGHVLSISGNGQSVPQRNIQFIEEFMRTEGIPVVNHDLGGYLPRRIYFHTDTGKVYVKRLGQSTLRLARMEEEQHTRKIRVSGPEFGGVTLFR
ncbi:MAG: chemotaxis protein CheD [Candidatus Rokubacteria bacterium]|nr:chemotaxis protein CheD [Candidatus Rokubacteria bacterium]